MHKATAFKEELQSKMEDLVDGVSDQYDSLVAEAHNANSSL